MHWHTVVTLCALTSSMASTLSCLRKVCSREISADSVLVKLDFKNAFNSYIRRDVVVRACEVHIPELYSCTGIQLLHFVHSPLLWQAHSRVSGRCAAGRPFGSFTLLSCSAASGGKATI
jgi:hypothetical protein